MKAKNRKTIKVEIDKKDLVIKKSIVKELDGMKVTVNIC